MGNRSCLVLIALAVAPWSGAEARSASDLLDAMLAAERERAQGVTDYAMDVTVMDQPITQFFERTEIAIEGRSLTTFRLVPPDEARRRLGKGVEIPGLPPGLAQRSADLDPATVVAQHAEIVGQESIEGRTAEVVKADGLSLEQVADGGKFVIRTITLWIDTRDLVPLKMRMDGVVEQDGRTREMYLEKVDRDFRRVPGSELLLPYRSVVRMGGMLAPKDRAEMEKARTQLADFDRQMASMPADQQAMMRRMMGSKMDMVRKMAESGEFETETIVRSVRVNPGLSAAFADAPKSVPGAFLPHAPAAAPAPKEAAPDLRRAREACLQRKVEAAQAAKKKKRFGKLLGAVGRIAGRHATGGLATEVSRVSTGLYEAGATAHDLQEAADALGISKDDVAACENPAEDRR